MTIFLTVWFFCSIVGILYLCLRKQGYGLSATDTDLMVTSKQPQELTAPTTDWDDEFLRAEDAKHVIKQIKSTKVFFVADKNKPDRRLFDGFTWICICGELGHSMNLKRAETSFERHQKDKHEAALAELGRFK